MFPESNVSSVGDRAQPDSLGPVQQSVLGILMLSLSLLTSGGNAMVLHAVRTDKRLQTVCNMFIVSLASADFIVGAFVMPISTVYVLSGRWMFGRTLCQVWLALDYTASTASILNLLILSLDRYWSVTAPLRYLPKRTRSRARFMIACVWAASGLWIVPIFCWHWLASHGVHTIPMSECDPEYKESFPLKIVTGLLNFYIPLSIMYALYGRIFMEIRKRSQLEKQSSRGGRAGGAKSNNGGGGGDGGVGCNAGIRQPLIRQPAHRRIRDDEPSVQSDLVQVTFRFNRATAAATATHNSSPPQTPSPVGESSMSLGHNASLGSGMPHSSASSPCKAVAMRSAASLGNVLAPPAPPLQLPSTEDESMRVNEANGDSPERSAAGGELNRGDLLMLLRRLRRPRTTVRWPHFRLSSSLQKEVKAAKQLGVIMGAFTACFLPYFVLFVVVAFCPLCVSDRLMLVATWIGYANSAFNPVLYPLCNHAFRRKFRSMLRCERHRGGAPVSEAARALRQTGRAALGAAAAVVSVNRRALDGESE